MTLGHVGGVHAKDVGVVVGVLEAHQVHLLAQGNLLDVVHLYGTDAPVPDFFFAEHVGNPVYVTAVVHVLVHVQVAIVGGLLLHHRRVDAGV